MKAPSALSGPTAALPETPEPLQVEIEFTNACNARCSACPRSDMPKAGLLSAETLETILARYAEARESYEINRLLGGREYPKVTVAGGGDPLIHPSAVELLRRAVEAGFPTHLITNGSKATAELAERLVHSGISSICVSFWGIEKAEYEQAMRLPYEPTLANVERLASIAREAGVPLTIVWVRTPQITSTSEAVAAFWAERGIDVDLSDNHMWNRGGLTPIPRSRVAPDVVGRPDFDRRVWCSDLFFSDTYRWNGDAILCCCNYFTGRPQTLGNVYESSPADIAAAKSRILVDRPVPAMCATCELPRAIRAKWLAGPWLPLLGESERRMVAYDQPPE